MSVNSPPPATRTSKRTRKPTQAFLDSVEQRDLEFHDFHRDEYIPQTCAFNANIASTTAYYEALHQDDFKLRDDLSDPIAFLATTDGDTLHYGQAMKAQDRDQFKRSMQKEFTDHNDGHHWDIIPIEDVPKGEKVLDSVWAMRRKRNILTGKIYKWKARLNLHGGQQEFGVNYYETYSPVVNWFSCRLLLIHALINKWHTRQIDFVLAYPQAKIEHPLYMKFPHGITTKLGSKRSHVLKLRKNLYGQKQAGLVWFRHLTRRLKKIGFKQSKVDECIFYKGSCVFFFYVDDGIFLSPDSSLVDKAIQDLKNENLNIEDQGDIADYLGINFNYEQNGTIVMSQPQLIDQLIVDVKFKNTKNLPDTPALSTHILQRDENASPFNKHFHYRSVVGKLNYLGKGTRPDIGYATHQCARFCEDPRVSHGKAVEHLVKYLKSTRKQGIILKPDKSKTLEVYADADFFW